MELTTDELVAEALELVAKSRAMDGIDRFVLVRDFPGIFYKKRNGVIAVRRSPQYKLSKDMWEKYPLDDQKINVYVRFAVSDQTGEPVNLSVILETGIIEFSHEVSQYLVKNYYVTEMLSNGWMVTAR